MRGLPLLYAPYIYEIKTSLFILFSALTVAQVIQAAQVRWLRPEEYLAILMNHARYVPLYLPGPDNLILPANVEEGNFFSILFVYIPNDSLFVIVTTTSCLFAAGHIILCNLQTEEMMAWVLLEENAVLVSILNFTVLRSTSMFIYARASS